MANLETQILDDIIVKSRRKMLTLGGAALAGLVMAPKANAQTTTVGDTDILNFALNLEYLEANFYYLAAYGITIDATSNSYSTAAGAAKLGITGTGTQGTVAVKSNPKVPFANALVAAYAAETAVEEGKHVSFLRTALGSLAVAQPAIDLNTAFNTLASAAGIGPAFDPFANDFAFLAGAYIFEDVGVTAYTGAAPLFTTGTTGKGYLGYAAGILAVEAYHAGLVRTTINALDTVGTYITITNQVSALRAKLSLAALSTAPSPDDYGLSAPSTAVPQTVSLGGTNYNASQIVDADRTNAIGFSRNTTQVLNIVTGGGAGTTTTPVSPAKGVFFPAGMNGLIK